jgi:hypothetical protein
MSNREILSAGLLGPFELAYDVVADEVVAHRPGAYALGYTDLNGRFCVTFVGSSITDLKEKLKEHIGTARQFKFRHFATEKAAFEKECELFHQFLPVGNFLHPERPPNVNWECVRCLTRHREQS